MWVEFSPSTFRIESFTGIIFMSYKGKWSNVIRNVDELVQNVHVGTPYVMGDISDLFPQTTFKF